MFCRITQRDAGSEAASFFPYVFINFTRASQTRTRGRRVVGNLSRQFQKFMRAPIFPENR
jgi:hypothetical protein